MNCRHCVHYSREKNEKYCAKWCKELKKELLREGLLRQETNLRLRHRACLREGGKERIMIVEVETK